MLKRCNRPPEELAAGQPPTSWRDFVGDNHQLAQSGRQGFGHINDDWLLPSRADLSFAVTPM